MHKKIIAVIVFFATLFYSLAFSGQKFAISQYENQDIATQTTKALPNIIKACPGLEKYAEDFVNAKAVKATMADPLYNKGFIIEFTVADQPQKLPRPLKTYSMKNNCFIHVSNNAETMYITKRACHSICTGIWTENTPGEMGREFNLDQ